MDVSWREGSLWTMSLVLGEHWCFLRGRELDFVLINNIHVDTVEV